MFAGRPEAGALAPENGRRPDTRAPPAPAPALGGALRAALAATSAAVRLRLAQEAQALLSPPASAAGSARMPAAAKGATSRARGMADAAQREALKISAYMLAHHVPRGSILQGGGGTYVGLPMGVPGDLLHGVRVGGMQSTAAKVPRQRQWLCCWCC